MTMASRGGVKDRAQLQLEREDGFVSINVSLLSTLATFAMANVAFVLRSAEFAQWRQPRTEFAFSPPTHDFLSVIIIFAVGAIAVRERQWVVPYGVGLILCGMTIGGVAWSGPGYLFQAVKPLMDFEMEMWGSALLLNAAIVIVWICLSKRRAKPATHMNQVGSP